MMASPKFLGKNGGVSASKFNSGETPDFISKQDRGGDYFFLNLRPSQEAPFTVVCGGLESCDTGYQIDREGFEYFAIEYVVSGACGLVLDKRSYNLNAGSIFCYGPSIPHRIRNIGTGPLTKFFVNFTGREVESLIREPFLAGSSPYQLPNLESMHGLFKQILETGREGAVGCQRILRQLIELIAMTTRFNAVDLGCSGSRSYQTYARCRSEIERNFATIHSVEELAESCDISTGYLCRIFRKFTDETPMQMLTRLKMNRAGKLLLHDQMMVKEAAVEVGFHDPYHFSRVFKDCYGIPPKAFRESGARGASGVSLTAAPAAGTPRLRSA